MNILVCIKQVPDTTEIKIDPETNRLIRDGVPSIVNTFDKFALEAAARVKDKNNEVQIYVVSMGPPQAKEALRECLAIAADKAYLVTDRAFGGSDTLATSYILSQAVKKIESENGIRFDAILCGKQAIDGDTGQVGPEMAEHLNLSLLTYALEVEDADDRILVLREGQDANEKWSIDKPALITFTKPSFEPRYPNIRRKMLANRAEIREITLADLPEINSQLIGLAGSPTRVKNSFVPKKHVNGVKIDHASADSAANTIVKLLHEEHIL